MAGPAQRRTDRDDQLAGLAQRLGRTPRIAVIVAPYYEEVADQLQAGARQVLMRAGAEIDTVEVEGALEIPQALEIVLGAPDGLTIDGAIVIGCVIRGETSHYDIVVTNANHWVMEVAMRYRVPVGNAILTVDTMAQALARASGDGGGKGADAARAVLGLVALSADRNGGRSGAEEITV